ncbi:MAG: hypothetical protein WD740_06200 [Anaerolineales bacterium]
MTHTLVPPKTFLAMVLILLLAGGCTLPTGEPTDPGSLQATPPAAALETVPLPTDATTAALLPHALYHLSAHSGSAQVWRLERDGTTQTQISFEDTDVLSFDVSPADGSVAFVSANQLYLVESDGGNRRLLVDNAAADAQSADYYFAQRLSDPLFSPDGRHLAYAYNGLWILDLTTFQAVHVLGNQVRIRQNGSTVLDGYYAPRLWAPNGQLLLLTVGDAQTSQLAFLSPSAGAQVTPVESSTVCCHAAWAPDSSSVMVANPYIGLVNPGLWRYAAGSGEQTALLAAEDENEIHFAGWPLQLTDGDLVYFYATAAEVPEGDVPLYMVRSAADGVSSRSQLRPDAFSNLIEVLWAGDGTLALLVQSRPDGGPSGVVLLAGGDGRQLQLLLENGYALKWGP